jgi:hypothetical protein
MVTKVTASTASATQANTQNNTQNAQNNTQANATAAQSFATAMQAAKNAQAGSPSSYVQNLQNDLKVLNTPVYNIHDPLYSAQVNARQSIYSNLMQASQNGQIDSVLKALTPTELSTITSQLERGLSLQGDPAFTQTQRDTLFKAMVTGNPNAVNSGASGQSLAKFMSNFNMSGADVLSMLNASGAKPGLTNQILNNYNTNLLNAQLESTTTPAQRSQQLYQNLNHWQVSASNQQRMADSLTNLIDVVNFKTATGVTPSSGYLAPPSWSAYSASNPNGDPINIIISGKSNVPIGQILNGLGDLRAGWWGQGLTSTENFDSGLGSQGQDYALRQGNWVTELNNPVLTGGPPIDHLRVWQQPGTGGLLHLGFQRGVHFQTDSRLCWRPSPPPVALHSAGRL